jgi:hypothetical protein
MWVWRYQSCNTLPKLRLTRPAPWTTLETSPSPILRGMSRPPLAALRLAESALRQPVAARGGPPVEACGRGDGAKKAFILSMCLIEQMPPTSRSSEYFGEYSEPSIPGRSTSAAQPELEAYA